MNIYVVIVTYGNRFDFCKQAIISCVKNKIKKIVIVDNGSNYESSEKLKEYSNKYKNIIELIPLMKNCGSAYGFKIGIEYAYQREDCDYILLLDDDNVLDENYNLNLKLILDENERKNKKNIIAYSSYRPALKQYENRKIKKNTFIGFHINQIPVKFKKLILNKFKTKQLSNKILNNQIIVDTAPYGGFLFHKSLIDKIGFSNEFFVLYQDDVEFTYRIKNKNGLIYLLKSCIVKDVQSSCGGEKNENSFVPFLNINNSKIYYNIRNCIYFEKYLKNNNNLIRNINMIIYLILIKCYLLLKNNIKKYKIILEAINDGNNGILGYNEKYPLL